MSAAKLTVSDSLDIQNIVDDWYNSLIIYVFCSISTVFQLNEFVVSGFVTSKYWYYCQYKCFAWLCSKVFLVAWSKTRSINNLTIRNYIRQVVILCNHGDSCHAGVSIHQHFPLSKISDMLPQVFFDGNQLVSKTLSNMQVNVLYIIKI